MVTTLVGPSPFAWTFHLNALRDSSARNSSNSVVECGFEKFVAFEINNVWMHRRLTSTASIMVLRSFQDANESQQLPVGEMLFESMLLLKNTMMFEFKLFL